MSGDPLCQGIGEAFVSMTAPRHFVPPPLNVRATPLLSRHVQGSLCLLAALVPFGTAIRAQDSQPVATFQSQATLVNVYASARDKDGKIVTDLNKDDFAVEEDGRPQKITFFSREDDMPLLLGLMVDTSPSEARMIEEERNASRVFLASLMDPKKDNAFLIHFDSEVELMQDLTPSVEKMVKALDKLVDAEGGPSEAGKAETLTPAGSGQGQKSPGPPGSSPQSPPGNSGNAAGQDSETTQLYDAVYLASTEVLNNQEGRKALIIIGDGDDVGSVVTEARAIRAAQRADVLIYCIRIVDKDAGGGGKKGVGLPGISLPGMGGGGPGGPGGTPGGGGPGGPPPGGGPGGQGGKPGGKFGSGPLNLSGERPNGKKNMQDLASQTGGALFEVTKKTSLLDVFAQIQDEVRGLYSLGYTPEANAQPGYRRLTVTANRKGLNGLKVQARPGYYASSGSN